MLRNLQIEISDMNLELVHVFVEAGSTSKKFLLLQSIEGTS